MPETAEALGRAVGRKIAYVRIPLEEVRKNSEDFAIMLDWFDKVGYDADIERMAREFGIMPTRLEEWARSQRA